MDVTPFRVARCSKLATNAEGPTKDCCQVVMTTSMPSVLIRIKMDLRAGKSYQ